MGFLSDLTGGIGHFIGNSVDSTKNVFNGITGGIDDLSHLDFGGFKNDINQTYRGLQLGANLGSDGGPTTLGSMLFPVVGKNTREDVTNLPQDVYDFERKHLANIGNNFGDNPTKGIAQLALGAEDPLSSSAWNGILQKPDYFQSNVNQYGGATGGDYQYAANRGVDPRGAMAMGAIANTIAGSYAGGGINAGLNGLDSLVGSGTAAGSGAGALNYDMGNPASGSGGLDYSSLGTNGRNLSGLQYGSGASNVGLTPGNVAYAGNGIGSATGGYSGGGYTGSGDIGGSGLKNVSSGDGMRASAMSSGEGLSSPLSFGNSPSGLNYDMSAPITTPQGTPFQPNDFTSQMSDMWNKFKQSPFSTIYNNTLGSKYMPLAKAAYGYQQQRQTSKEYRQRYQDQYNQIQESLGALKDIYSPNSAYAQQMKQQLERSDAAGGRRSQYGERGVELAAKLAGLQSQNEAQRAKLTSGLSDLNTAISDTKRAPQDYLLSQLTDKDVMGSLASLF